MATEMKLAGAAVPLNIRVQPRIEPVDNGDGQNEPLTLSPASKLGPMYNKNLKALREIFQDHMRNKPVKHDRAQVLLLSWTDELDDLGVRPEVSSSIL